MSVGSTDPARSGNQRHEGERCNQGPQVSRRGTSPPRTGQPSPRHRHRPRRRRCSPVHLVAGPRLVVLVPSSWSLLSPARCRTGHRCRPGDRTMSGPTNETTREGTEGEAGGNAKSGQHRRRFAATLGFSTHQRGFFRHPPVFSPGPFSFAAGAHAWSASLPASSGSLAIDSPSPRWVAQAETNR